jgi:hypothetical protein
MSNVKQAVVDLPSRMEVCQYLEIPLLNSPDLYALERLFQRPWFSQAWVYHVAIER